MAHDAVVKAANADVVIFAMEARGDLPARGRVVMRNGSISAVSAEASAGGFAARAGKFSRSRPFREIYLRHAARRAGWIIYPTRRRRSVTRCLIQSIRLTNEPCK